jgi:aspartyl/asparaginyl-tRNA synthetase
LNSLHFVRGRFIEFFRLANGVSVRLTGKLTKSPGAGQDHELQVDAVEVLGECDPDVRFSHFVFVVFGIE